MKKLLLLFTILLLTLSAQASAGVVVNEVHAAGDEWVEIYNSGDSSIDLSSWKIADNNSDDPLESLILNEKSFGLIIDDEINCSEFNLSEESCQEEAAIGSGLNDGRENLTLYNSSGAVVDNLIWTSDQEETYSIGRVPDGGPWNYSLTPTPGESNGDGSGGGSDDTTNTPDTTHGGDEGGASTPTSSGTERNLIRIVDFPGSAKFGGIVNVEMEVSKNETNKYAIYSRIERKSDGWDVSEETKVYLREKNTNYSLMIPILIKANCGWRYGNGTYRLLVEGLGTEDMEEIEISGTREGVCEEVTKVKEKTKEVVKEVRSCNSTSSAEREEYEIFSYDEEVEAGESLETAVLIRNRDNESKELEVYSYIYRGNTPLNRGGWTGNSREIEIGPMEKEVLLMENEIKEDVNSSTYDLKVRIKGEEDLVRKVKVRGGNETPEMSNVTEEGNRTSKPSDNQTTTDISEGNVSTENKITGRVFRKKGPLEKFVDLFSGVFDLL